MIGGSESIRDIQEAKNLQCDALEFSMVESIFSIKKITIAIEKVFKDQLHTVSNLKFFINISTVDGLNTISEIDKLGWPKYIQRKNIIFNFDRRSIAKFILNIDNENFNYSEYDSKISPLILEKILYLKDYNFSTSLSGGIDKKGLSNIFLSNCLPEYIKTGLFTIKINNFVFEDLYNDIFYLQKLESKLLKLMSDSIYSRFNYINKRYYHLEKYIENNS
tara:strand:+ start:1359 stop:2018 length:660 start_codon:yes stop_codon:yes gene_type:complete